MGMQTQPVTLPVRPSGQSAYRSNLKLFNIKPLQNYLSLTKKFEAKMPKHALDFATECGKKAPGRRPRSLPLAR